jgi:hypothetical protein
MGGERRVWSEGWRECVDGGVFDARDALGRMGMHSRGERRTVLSERSLRRVQRGRDLAFAGDVRRRECQRPPLRGGGGGGGGTAIAIAVAIAVSVAVDGSLQPEEAVARTGEVHDHHASAVTR